MVPSQFAKRACTAACIAAVVAPSIGVDPRVLAGDEAQLLSPAAVIHAVGQTSSADDEVTQVVGKQPGAGKTSAVRALHLADPSRPAGMPQAASSPSYVRPVAGGLLDGWFSGQKSKSGATAKKEHEDGRKATALPPPDPSEVDWSGVPFHQPKRSGDNHAASEPAPLRDAQRGTSGAPTSTATLRRSNGTASPRQGLAGQAVSSRPSSASGRTGSGLLPAPDLGSMTRDTATQTLRAPASNTSAAAELSSIKSSRRSDRRAIDALTVEPSRPAPEDEVEQEAPTASVALNERLPVPSVPRRELTPTAEADSGQSSAESDRASGTAANTPRRETIPLLPRLPQSPADVANSDIPPLPAEKAESSTDALVDSWQSVGSGVSRTPVTTPVGADSSTSNIPKPVDSVVSESTRSDSGAAAEKALRDQLIEAPVRASQGSGHSTAHSSANATSPADTRKAASASKSLAASELPGVRVVTEGPSEIMNRELTQYEIRVENRGSFDATGIVVQSSLPAWAQVQGHNASLGTIKTIDQSGQPQLQWTIDKLPAGVVERLFIRVKAVKSGVFDVATDWTMLPQKHVAKVTVREPKLLVTIDGPEEIIYGRSEKYRVRVMNPGDGDAANVVFTLSPDSKVPQSQTIGSIPAGKEAQFEIELTARELGELKIGGVAVADRDVKTTANKSIRVAAANVEAELTGPPLKYQNAEATYHLTVTNSGKANCESIEAELRLPAGVKYVSGVQQASMQGDRLTWKIDALQPGAVREYDIVCKLDRTGELVLAFNCNGSAAGRASVSIETKVEAIADLALSVSDPVAPAPVGAEVAYEITIVNRGSKAAEAVRVVAQFGPGIEPIRVEGHTGEVVTGQALFNPVARIEPGSSLRLKVVAKADRAGDHRFRAEVRHGETSLVSEEATMFMNIPAERISRRSTSR